MTQKIIGRAKVAASQKRSIPLSGSRECFSALLDMLSDPHRQCLFGRPQLIGLLQVHPNSAVVLKNAARRTRRIARNATLAFDNRRDPIRRHFEGFSQCIGVNRRI